MQKLLAFFTVALVMFAVHGIAQAQNPHFVGQVRATDLGTQLQVQASIAGLGNQNVDVLISAQGEAIVDCQNPGGNIAPGQRTQVTATGSAQNLEVKNGRVNFNITTNEPPISSASCPNAKWTPILRDVIFSSFTITVFQPAGSGIVVLQQTFPVQ